MGVGSGCVQAATTMVAIVDATSIHMGTAHCFSWMREFIKFYTPIVACSDCKALK